ncbi:MAG: GIDE domain-containing protein [Myxococcota bacterium]
MPLVAIGLLLATLALVLAWTRSRAEQTPELLRGAERIAISQYPQGGQKRVVGTLSMNGEPLVAPLTGRACAAYEVVVEEASQDSGTHWTVIAREVRAEPFIVDDGTGRAFVDPAGATLAITRDSRSQSGIFKEPDSREADFLARHGESTKGTALNRSLRFCEGALELGETVAVLGRGAVSFDDDPTSRSHEGGYRRNSQATKIEISAGPRTPVYISDAPFIVDA